MNGGDVIPRRLTASVTPEHASTQLNPVEPSEVVKYHSIGAGELRGNRGVKGPSLSRR